MACMACVSLSVFISICEAQKRGKQTESVKTLQGASALNVQVFLTQKFYIRLASLYLSFS